MAVTGVFCALLAGIHKEFLDHEKLVQAKDQFISVVSHEIRTPLTAVLGFSQVLYEAHDLEPDEARSLLALITEQSREASDLVEDLLIGARADIGSLVFQQEVFEASTEVERVVAALPEEARQRIGLRRSPALIEADPGRFRQVLRNMLTNAIRHGGRDISVTVTSVADLVSVTVSDNGPGIPESDRESIFEPYRRATHVPTHHMSVGLGLTVARRLAELMGGSLTYDYEEATSRFRLSLPAAARPAAKHRPLGGEQPAMV